MAKQLKDFLDGLDNASEVEKIIEDNLKKGKCKLFIDDGEKNIYVPKARLDAKINDLKNAQNTIDGLNADIKTLKGKVKDDSDAQATIKGLEDKLAVYDKSIKEMRIDNAIQSLGAEFKAKDYKDLKGFVKLDNVTISSTGEVLGIKEQVEKLVTEKPYLFNVEEPDNGEEKSNNRGFNFRMPGKPDNTNLFNSKSAKAGEFGHFLGQAGAKTGEGEPVINSDYYFNK